MIESDGIVVAGAGVPHAKRTKQATRTGNINFFMVHLLIVKVL
jgi:hypothetical protein